MNKPKTNNKDLLIRWMKSSVAKYKPFKPSDFADLIKVVKSPMTISQIAGVFERSRRKSYSWSRALCFRAVVDSDRFLDVATPSINPAIFSEAETNGSSYVFFPRNWRRQNVLKLQPPSPSLEEEMQARGDNEDARFDIAIREPTGRERLSNACVAYMSATGRIAYYLDHVLEVNINGLTVEFRSSPGESLRIMKSLLRGIKK